MIKNQRDKLINEQAKDKIEQYLKVLEEVSELEKSGDKDGVEKCLTI